MTDSSTGGTTNRHNEHVGIEAPDDIRTGSITTPAPAALELDDVTSFRGTVAVRDISMTIPANHVTALIGPSGAGKTTLLRAMNRLHDATRGAMVSGSIRHDGMDLYGPGSDPVLVRTRIGMVFQRPNVFPTMSILDNVVSGLRFAGIRRKSMLTRRRSPG